MTTLLDEKALLDRILSHIDNKTTDMGNKVWKEPSKNYLSQERFDAEIALLRRSTVPFCPATMVADKGDFLARKSAGTPILLVRGMDGVARAFINACRHRGMPLADGMGCARAFVCPYHAWSYALDGSLTNIAGSHGFPSVDLSEHGLIEIAAREKGGLIYINQAEPIEEDALSHMPDFFSPSQKFFGQEILRDKTNWKLIAETTMEGYHIKGLHKNSFFPYGLDNTNIVEEFGPNSRVVFPFKRISKLRDSPQNDRDLTGMITSVYNLFPNTVVSILSKHSTLTIFEPIAPGQTDILIYRVTNEQKDGSTFTLEEAKRDAEFVKGAGFDEDREASVKIQEAVSSGRDMHFTFGLFEKAIVHFHQELDKRLD